MVSALGGCPRDATFMSGEEELSAESEITGQGSLLDSVSAGDVLQVKATKTRDCASAGVVTHHHRHVHTIHAYNDKLLELSRTAFQAVSRDAAEDVIACTTTLQQRLLSSFGQPPAILCEPLSSPHKCYNAKSSVVHVFGFLTNTTHKCLGKTALQQDWLRFLCQHEYIHKDSSASSSSVLGWLFWTLQNENTFVFLGT